MTKQALVMVGAGGHAVVLYDIIELLRRFEVVGCTDYSQNNQLVRLGVPYLGDDTVLPKLQEEGITNAVMGVAGLKNHNRQELYQRVKAIGFVLPALIHPAATVSAQARIGQGSVVMAGARINPAAVLGENVIVNTGAIVEHDCHISHFAQLGPGAILCGGVTVKEGALLGAGSCTIQGKVIGAYAVVGAGAVVTHDVPDGATVVGNPARIQAGEGVRLQ